MGMVVRTNTMALNAYRQLGMNNSAVAKSLEKLSSGYRINRAGDDAAGLAISEKMKAQIKGLETASANAQDGISLIQTAEGNLSEVHDMLNRMVELATKSANGTYTQTERDALQDEVDALLEEIDRISKSANFNGTNLLDGTMGLNKDAFQIGNKTDATPAPDLTSSLNLPAKKATGTATYPTDGYHVGAKGNEQGNPSFSIDVGDLAIKKGTSAAGDTSTVELAVAGVTLKTGNLAGAKDYNASDIVTELFKNTANWTGKNADQTSGTTAAYVDIGDLTFKVTGSGTTINFEYAGLKANAAAMADTDKLTAANVTAINTAIGAGVALNGTVHAKSVKEGDIQHNTLNVSWATEEKASSRAGIDLTLDATLVKEGNTLTIDGKTFTFVNADGKTVDELADDEIGIWTADAAADQLSKAVEQLSNKDTTNFDIEAKDGTKIHIDQKVGNDNLYDTYESLKELFSAKGVGAGESIALTVTEGSITSGDAIRVGDTTFKFVDKLPDGVDGNGKLDGTVYVQKQGAAANLASALNKNGFKATEAGGVVSISDKDAAKASPFIVGGGLTLQIGDTADDFNKMTVAVANMSTEGLGLKGLEITTESKSSNAIQRIKDAINTVSTTRASMGALQNRLEHTINNLDVAAENLSAANSRIRDTDMAKEMMNYTKMNVLVQSAQAMLAQANQQPQSVLQLLQ